MEKMLVLSVQVRCQTPPSPESPPIPPSHLEMKFSLDAPAPTGICPRIEFHLYKGSAGTPLVQTTQSTQTSVVLTVSNVDTSHQGSYSCLYRIPGSQPISSPRSNSIDITIVSLPKPRISISAREVTWGHNVDITCSISTEHSGGTFVLQKLSGSLTETRNASPNSNTFTFPAVDFVHHGAYNCQYKTRVSDRSFNSSHSDSVSFSVIVVLLQPNISLSDPAGGMIWAHQGPEVVRGSSFTITCSTPPQYPGGIFHLILTASNRTETQVAVNHSASFLFPAADYSHQGNYSCVYETTVSTRNFSSPQSELLPLMVRACQVALVTSGVLTGLLLLLLVSAAIFLVCRKKRHNQEQVQKQTINACAMNTYFNRGEANEDEDDEEDYVNAEDFNDQDDYEQVKEDDSGSEFDYENVSQLQESEDEDIYQNYC
ncbi:hypothetical protein MATL_G00212890 [Megalops atlanticus]|uniref:Ig-like domain-containing protein n=1 Tax=Megalops atlanticus TaxID=7932 RepID=A0A9D3PG38_MEGAT|nr:hypothetical protein MATL_G00212890 [Megalops atlanticus]